MPFVSRGWRTASLLQVKALTRLLEGYFQLREQLLDSSVTYRIAVGAQLVGKVLTPLTQSACDDSLDYDVGKVAGSSLHGGVAPGGINARSSRGCVGTMYGEVLVSRQARSWE